MLLGTRYHVNMAQAPGHRPLSKQTGASPVRCTPQIQNRVSAPDCSPKPQWLREEERLVLETSSRCLVSTPPQPTVGLLAPALYTPPTLLFCV